MGGGPIRVYFAQPPPFVLFSRIAKSYNSSLAFKNCLCNFSPSVQVLDSWQLVSTLTNYLVSVSYGEVSY